MSADAWSICPRCLKQHEQRRQEALDNAQAAYGKIPADDYDAMLAKAISIPARPEESLRQDWEIHTTETGKFYISYGCRCECGFEFSYQHEEQLEFLGDNPE